VKARKKVFQPKTHSYHSFVENPANSVRPLEQAR